MEVASEVPVVRRPLPSISQGDCRAGFAHGLSLHV